MSEGKQDRVASSGNTGPPIPMEYYPAPAHGPLHPGPGYNQVMTNAVVVQQPASTYVAGPIRPDDHFIIAMFACLCCFFPTAIVALMHSCKVNELFDAGDYAGAERASRKAYYWSKVSIIVGVISTVVLIVTSIVLFIVVPVVVIVGAAAAAN